MVELMVASTISVLILAGVCTTFLSLSRASLRSGYYSDMEAQARKGMEYFGQDIRMASDITWNSSTSLTVKVPTSSGTDQRTYQFSGTNFTRTYTLNGATQTDTLFSGITSGTLSAYTITGASLSLSNLTTANANTKEVQITIKTTRTGSTLAASTARVVSARYILRNKKVTS